MGLVVALARLGRAPKFDRRRSGGLLLIGIGVIEPAQGPQLRHQSARLRHQLGELFLQLDRPLRTSDPEQARESLAAFCGARSTKPRPAHLPDRHRTEAQSSWATFAPASTLRTRRDGSSARFKESMGNPPAQRRESNTTPAGRALPHNRRATHDATRPARPCLVALSAMAASIRAAGAPNREPPPPLRPEPCGEIPSRGLELRARVEIQAKINAGVVAHGQDHRNRLVRHRSLDLRRGVRDLCSHCGPHGDDNYRRNPIGPAVTR